MCQCKKPMFVYTNVSRNLYISKCSHCKFILDDVKNTVNTVKSNKLTQRLFWVKNKDNGCGLEKKNILTHENNIDNLCK
jgi:hypothetical protein